MARSVRAKIGGKTIALKATFDAAEEISSDICDLCKISNEMRRTVLFEKMGRQYKPEFEFSTTNIKRTLEIACRHSEADVSEDDVKAYIMDVGLDKALELAGDYMRLFFAQPETKPEGDADDSGEGGKK